MNKYNDILEGMRNIYSAKLVTMELEGKHEEVRYCLNFIKELDNRYAWKKSKVGYTFSYLYTNMGENVENLIFGIAHSYGFDVKFTECTYRLTKDKTKEQLPAPVKFYCVHRDNIPLDWNTAWEEWENI